MLVLSRKVEEKLLLNGNIEIRILEVKKGRVRIGIEAPRDVPIERMELLTEAACHESADAFIACLPAH